MTLTDSQLLAHLILLMAHEDDLIADCPLCAEIQRRIDEHVPHDG